MTRANTTQSFGDRPVVSIARILRDYREAGSLNGLLALWPMLDDEVQFPDLRIEYEWPDGRREIENVKVLAQRVSNR